MSGTATPPPTEGAPPAQQTAALLGASANNSGQPPAGAGNAAPGTDERTWLPEEYRGSDVFKDIKDVGALAKSYEHAARLVGVDKGQVLRIPGADDAEGWNGVFAQLGRPEAPEGYEFPALPGELLDGMEATTRTAFHKAGLSGAQGKAVMELYGGLVQQAQEQRIAKANEIEAAVVADLQKEWGDTFEERITQANRVINELGGEQLAQAMQTLELADGTRLGQHPALIRFLAEIGSRMAEPGALKGVNGGGSGPGTWTAESAQAEVARLRTDRDFLAARRDPKHADHAAATAKWDALHQAIAKGAAGRVE